MDLLAQTVAANLARRRRSRPAAAIPCIPRPVAAPPEEVHDSSSTAVLDRNLVDDWDSLAQAVRAEPWLQPGWISAWWNVFGKQSQLLVQSVRTEGALTAITPVVRTRNAVYAAANEHSPGFDILASNSRAAIQLAHDLYAHRPVYLSMAALTQGNAAMRYINAAAQFAGHRVVKKNYAHSPFLSVSGSFPEYEAGLSRPFIAALNKSYRRLARSEKAGVQLADGMDNLDRLLDEAFTVEASGWKGIKGTAINSHPETHNFYRSIASWAAERNMLRLFFLRVGQRPIAMYFALEQYGICYLLKGGYDESYARCSPGALLMRRVIEHCFSTGISRIEFLGNATPHKLRWTSSVHERYRLETFARNVPGILAVATLGHAKPALSRGLSACRAPFRVIRSTLR